MKDKQPCHHHRPPKSALDLTPITSATTVTKRHSHHFFGRPHVKKPVEDDGRETYRVNRDTVWDFRSEVGAGISDQAEEEIRNNDYVSDAHPSKSRSLDLIFRLAHHKRHSYVFWDPSFTSTFSTARTWFVYNSCFTYSKHPAQFAFEPPEPRARKQEHRFEVPTE
ncbi:hypothetical protein BT69DRAFT_471511 [Atractiella rhizophila]|nr:hypothetical protein BT69DRAFT_471511 [Atractiella rhizophila]